MVRKLMFWSSPSGDVRDTIYLIIASFIISAVLFLFKKKVLLSAFIFSLLSNLVVWGQYETGSLMFRVYDLFWLRDLARYYWPIINLILLTILIFNYRKDVKNKK